MYFCCHWVAIADSWSTAGREAWLKSRTWSLCFTLRLGDVYHFQLISATGRAGVFFVQHRVRDSADRKCQQILPLNLFNNVVYFYIQTLPCLPCSNPMSSMTPARSAFNVGPRWRFPPFVRPPTQHPSWIFFPPKRRDLSAWSREIWDLELSCGRRNPTVRYSRASQRSGNGHTKVNFRWTWAWFTRSSSSGW